MSEKQKKEFHTVVHTSTFRNGNVSGYGAVISITRIDRKVVFGCVTKEEAPAHEICAELHAIEDAVDYLLSRKINEARFVTKNEKTIDALTGKVTLENCVAIPQHIIRKIGDLEYTFIHENEDKPGTAATMAKRAAGFFNFKNGYKWDTEREEIVSDTLAFVIKEFYTRKSHEPYEYLNIACMYDHYTGPKEKIALPLSVRRTVDTWSANSRKQDVAAVFWKCGMLPADACKCASLFCKYPTKEERDAAFREAVKELTRERDHRNRGFKPSQKGIDEVVESITAEYHNGAYRLQTLEEAVSAKYLDVLKRRV